MSALAQQIVRWRKSSYSGAGSNCVEVALIGATVAVRDTKDRGAGKLEIPVDRWADFIRALR